MILATGHVQSDSTNLLEVLRPMPEEFRKDVDNTEFTEKKTATSVMQPWSLLMV